MIYPICSSRTKTPGLRLFIASKLDLTALILLLLLFTTMQPVSVHAQSILYGSISVDNNKVSTSTTFNFDLISPSETVASNDYLEIVLPSELDSKFSSSGNPVCEVEDGRISQCLFISSKVCRIVFNQRMTTKNIRGSVSGFINPLSNRAQSNIKITLYDD